MESGKKILWRYGIGRSPHTGGTGSRLVCLKGRGWGECGDDAGPWRPCGRAFIYPRRMEETITVLKDGE